ncbi:Alpha/Beta hydrolase protein [Syncephalis plumigaleata]|nr:Alpha/Beta hydrolase protein [Syncephalis plumigaleata]
MIEGRGGTFIGWLKQAKLLAMKGYQVCIFDNRGVGQSEKVEEEFTMMDMTIDTVELLDHLGWTSKAHLKVLFPEHWLSAPSTLHHGKLNRDVAIELIAYASDHDPNISELQTKAVMTHLITEEQFATIRNSKIPVLVCTGDEDALVVPANSEYIAKMLQSPLKVFKGCGHLIEVQEPEEYSRMITEHIEKASNHHNASIVNE